MRKATSLLFPLTACLLLSCNNGGQSSSSSSAKEPIEFANPSFENGLTGWHEEGLGAFSDSCVVNEENVNNVPSLKEGSYFYSGSATMGSFTGTLESDYFTLDGLGLLSFRMGAAKDQSKIYLEFFKEGSDEPLSFYVNGGEEAVSKVGNMDFNGSTITDQMIIKYVDLSDYLDENIKIKVTDNDTSSLASDYSYINLDAFSIIENGSERAKVISQRESELAAYQDDFEEDPTSTSLRNGGFETGDLTGWKVVEGEAFDETSIDVSAAKFWDTRDYHAKGNYFLNGLLNGEAKVGKLRSEKFTQNGDYVSFYMGAASQGTTEISIYDVTKNQTIKNVSNAYFSDPDFAHNLVLNVIDVSEYKGDVMYFLISDQASDGGFAFLTADEFAINQSEDDVKALIEKEKEDAASYGDAAKYLDLYSNKESFPLAGEAPKIAEADGYAYKGKISPMSAFDAIAYIKNNVSYSDDFTAKNDLVLALTSVKKGDEAIAISDTYDLSNGFYEFEFSLSDAYSQTSTGKLKLEVIDSTCSENVTNGDFETGNADGWTLESGEADLAAAICGDSTYWGEKIPFNKGGTYFWNGWNAISDESKGYRLKSSAFHLSGSGYISLAMGGNSAMAALYKQNGTQVGLYKNTAFHADDNLFPYVGKGARYGTMTHYLIDASSCLGEDLYLVLIDEEGHAGDWGVAFFDDVVTHYETVPNVSGHEDTFKDATIDPNNSKYDADYDGKDVTISWQTASNSL